MRYKIWIGSAVLLAIAALEFGLLGAGAAGLTGRHERPGDLGVVPATATPTAAGGCADGVLSPPCIPCAGIPTSPPCPPPSPPGPPSPPVDCTIMSPPSQISPPGISPPAASCDEPFSIEISADPLEILCDGGHSSMLTVHVRNRNGRDVPNGTPVYISNPWGGFNQYSPATYNGVVQAAVWAGPVPYASLTSFTLNITVVGRIEATFRVLCTPVPVSPPPCFDPLSPPSVSPPCATPTPAPCAPFGVSNPGGASPPCETPTPAPSIGGEISFGTPSLAGGVLEVPVLTTAALDPYVAFQIDATYDAGLLAFQSGISGGALETSGAQTFCFAAPTPTGRTLFVCTLLGSGSTSAAGTLAILKLKPNVSEGCATLHLFTYGPPDDGGLNYGTLTVGTTNTVQQNTYGPDVTVDLSDGSTGCTPSAGGTAPPTPTETAVPTSTPTAVPTSTSTLAPEVCGDITGDGRVTVVDLLRETAITHRRNAPARYDLNGDGRVDQQDLAIVGLQVGRRCT